MNKQSARIILSSFIFFFAAMVCCLIPNMEDEKMRQRGWTGVEHSLGVWDYSGILFLCIAAGIVLAGIWLSNRE